MNRAIQSGGALPDMPSIAILGAGMSGIAMGIALKKAGFHSFTIFEKAAGIGGTWWDNTYPGAQCDVRSHLYSYSFEPNPDWSRTFAPQAEIQRYMARCAEKYGLMPHIRLNCAITDARFDAGSASWRPCVRKAVKQSLPTYSSAVRRRFASRAIPTFRAWLHSAASCFIHRAGTTASTSRTSGSR
jgi:phytoene dehydrogenase-like protein